MLAKGVFIRTNARGCDSARVFQAPEMGATHARLIKLDASSIHMTLTIQIELHSMFSHYHQTSKTCWFCTGLLRGNK